MDRPNLSLSRHQTPNPFLIFQSRYWVLGTYLIASVVLGLLYGFLSWFSVVPTPSEDPISVPILSIGIWAILAGIIVLVGQHKGLRLGPLFGPFLGRALLRSPREAQRAVRMRLECDRVSRFSLPYAGLLVASLLIFSLGSFSVVFYYLSLNFPERAASMLETDLILGGGDSQYPQLYDGLMLFWLVVYAPLVEELVFRGILLQRWGTKWGLRRGVMASSVLFGLLHLNNPLGLTLFGLVMGLLYVRSRSLWVPIVCHALNNMAAVAIDGFSKMTGVESSYSVADVQASWQLGLVLIAISGPFLAHFVWRSWPQQNDKIPYLFNTVLPE
ncbi:MAG: CPBP family intramembrane glutamic endopeptidase [Cyanobacteria bacterium J06597_16]